MRTATEVAQKWTEAANRASRIYMQGRTPQERLADATRAYLDGSIELETFEQIAAEAIRDGA